MCIRDSLNAVDRRREERVRRHVVDHHELVLRVAREERVVVVALEGRRARPLLAQDLGQAAVERYRCGRHACVAAAAVPLYGGLAEILGEQGASAATFKRNNNNAFFASHPKYKFVMVNHVTTNSFFTATI